MQIGYLFKDKENNIVSIAHADFIKSQVKMNDEFEINTEFVADRFKIVDDTIEKVDTVNLCLSDLLPLALTPFYLKLIGFTDDRLNDRPILKKGNFYFFKSKSSSVVRLAYRFDTDAVYPVYDMCSMQLAIKYFQ